MAPPTLSMNYRNFKTTMCRFYKMNSCSKGAECTYAHWQEEQRRAPELAKTKLCSDWQNSKCRNKDCKYAHGDNELRSSKSSYKTSLCKYWNMPEGCPSASTCHYAHGEAELETDFIGPSFQPNTNDPSCINAVDEANRTSRRCALKTTNGRDQPRRRKKSLKSGKGCSLVKTQHMRPAPQNVENEFFVSREKCNREVETEYVYRDGVHCSTRARNPLYEFEFGHADNEDLLEVSEEGDYLLMGSFEDTGTRALRCHQPDDDDDDYMCGSGFQSDSDRNSEYNCSVSVADVKGGLEYELCGDSPCCDPLTPSTQCSLTRLENVNRRPNLTLDLEDLCPQFYED